MTHHEKSLSRRGKRLLIVILSVVVLVNVIAFIHAYKFTHFTDTKVKKTHSPVQLSVYDKFLTLIMGINNPRPVNQLLPDRAFETIVLNSNKKIECWYFQSETTDTVSARGTVILFHGYGGNKSSMLDRSKVFNRLNYNTMLVDFMGSGGSEGNQTTLGFYEAAEVKSAMEYLMRCGEQNVYLFGTSMGAVAILKAVSEYQLHPKGIIIECPFGSMYQTTCARFHLMNAPVFPLAGLLVFWGGVQNRFWAFAHNPSQYATRVNCPTLLLYGEQDRNVSRQEIDAIYANLKGPKLLKIYSDAGHENYLTKYRNAWTQDVTTFLSTLE